MFSFKVLGVVAVFVAAPLIATDIRVASDGNEPYVVRNRETVVAAPCIGWRPEILDFAMTALLDSKPGLTPAPPETFPLGSVRLVSVPAKGSCKVVKNDGHLAEVPILAAVTARISYPVGTPNDPSGIYYLIEFQSSHKGERLVGGIVFLPPSPGQELRGIGRIHTLE